VGGLANFADWSLYYSIPTLGAGLEIGWADYRGTRVIWSAGAPFVLVPYHSGSPAFKDGLNYTACGSGIGFSKLIPTAPNAPSWQLPPSAWATNDSAYDPNTNPGGAIAVEQELATELEARRLVVWAKFQAWNYQYVHHWEFHADGSIHASVGLAGLLYPSTEFDNVPGGRGHIHNFYFRLDFDVVSAGNNLVQRFAHPTNALNADTWTDVTTEGKQSVDPAQFTRWRVLNKSPKPNGLFRSYELSPGSDGLPDGTYSTGDLWVVRYRWPLEDGAVVACTDDALQTVYATPPENVDGQDVVLWYCLRHHHRPRHRGEEETVVPYEFVTFHLAPRDFLDATPKPLYDTVPPSPL
jgi:hypothetical protein